ncbi:MAG: hypothetical protein EOO38_16725 [Cytophagaceae bacterium]|nr:MAG: hypothetical protein EOO38_16725 [Cytophagaceae bacterium]
MFGQDGLRKLFGGDEPGSRPLERKNLGAAEISIGTFLRDELADRALVFANFDIKAVLKPMQLTNIWEESRRAISLAESLQNSLSEVGKENCAFSLFLLNQKGVMI